jgi:Protein of unknown function (DUF1579)
MTRNWLRMLMLVFAGSVVAQAGGQPPAKDPQSSFEPRSAPGAGQKYLERFVGDWDVAKTFYPRSGEPSRQKGECRQSMMHDGRFLKSEFTFEQGEGKKSTGTGVIGFEPASGKFTSVWTDSRQTRMSFRQSKDKFNGEEIVLFGSSLDPPATDVRRSRTVSRLEDGDKKLFHRQYSINPDGTERLVMELAMTRKQTPSPAK